MLIRLFSKLQTKKWPNVPKVIHAVRMFLPSQFDRLAKEEEEARQAAVQARVNEAAVSRARCLQHLAGARALMCIRRWMDGLSRLVDCGLCAAEDRRTYYREPINISPIKLLSAYAFTNGVPEALPTVYQTRATAAATRRRTRCMMIETVCDLGFAVMSTQ